MLYHLFDYLSQYDLPGARLMGYISFRAAAALILSILIATIIGRRIIDRLQLMQVGEIVRNLGIEGQMSKTGTPTMGGVIIIIAVLVPCLLVGNLTNTYMLLMIVSTLMLGALGFLDDYKKIKKHNKDGLKGKYKIVGQVVVGLIVGLTMYLSPDIVVNENVEQPATDGEIEVLYKPTAEKQPITTIPFVKSNNLNYAWFTQWAGEHAETAGWILFILVTIFVVAAVSNGANLTDGLDGLATGSSAIIGVALAVMCYLGGNIVYSSYLNIMYIPGSGELVVYAAAFIGALVGFLWYNAYPAQVFMGDTGSLTIGGIIGVFAILIRKELLIPVLCGIFLVENLSVIMQTGYFKYTKKKYGEGRRIFKMTPLHHHFQKQGNAGIVAKWQHPINPIPESKIVVRFWIVGIFLAIITFITLKIR
ncbi:MAG: phospho-N-acetylmuramoyl-pentapeptide-transferase [Bacteroidales bacterium]|nr:phospho-N-acetylmuramoyl-pentapeptide-transferase [Muribaculaceae bacterium]MCI6856319.1 phospho-N-acetylmuramoyl-pentapeptide-transferase [Bacteroidales bacterium]MDY5893547.1 phospho-N-acetylmuramoyl-pentapeptide-transferase [Candidatus Limisoma sp.]MDD7603282.1 phospho-N-acetylmuramoyl-pentapeptide-transferase [Bacteroidales bacterium]MDD7760795.1 phospho-N-acetylmuramoyl-pentapeptide-transferase [Bacteroidales bacterium]